MRHTRLLATAAAIALPAASALGGYTITQTFEPGPAYGGHSVTFDEPGVPVGVNLDPFDFYQASDGVTFQSNSGFLMAEDWDALEGIDGGQGDGNQIQGGFGVRMYFDPPITELQFQGWAPGWPAPPFGGVNVFVFKDGMQVAIYSGISPFGGIGDEWFNLVATDGDSFDELVFFNGAFNSWSSYVDNLSWGQPPTLDIKPGSCPNSFNRRSRGVLPVALVGTGSFDVTQVDLDSLLLYRADGLGGAVAPIEGPPGPHTVVEDVATPFEGEPCDCHEMMGDGIMDLSMKFNTPDVVNALELWEFEADDYVELCLSGTLLDGTPFEVCDCIRIVSGAWMRQFGSALRSSSPGSGDAPPTAGH